jgi:hypothetical protein
MQFRKALRGGDVHVMNGLRVDDQPLDRRISSRRPGPDARHHMPCIGKVQRRIEPIDEQAGHALRRFLIATIMEFAVDDTAAKNRVGGAGNLHENRISDSSKPRMIPAPHPAIRIARVTPMAMANSTRSTL